MMWWSPYSTPGWYSPPPQNWSNNNFAEGGRWPALWFELSFEMAEEMLRFASRRLAAQAELMGALSRCQSVGEAAQLQSSFATIAMNDYQQEANTVMRNVERTVRTKAA